MMQGNTSEGDRFSVCTNVQFMIYLQFLQNATKTEMRAVKGCAAWRGKQLYLIFDSSS